MKDEQNLVWVNKKTGLIASDSELNEMWEKPQHDLILKELNLEEINNHQTKESYKSDYSSNINLKQPNSESTIAWIFIFFNSIFILIGQPGFLCCSLIIAIPLYISFLIWSKNDLPAIIKIILIITFLVLLYFFGMYMFERAWESNNPYSGW